MRWVERYKMKEIVIFITENKLLIKLKRICKVLLDEINKIKQLHCKNYNKTKR
jgi:hypothetical protein